MNVSYGVKVTPTVRKMDGTLVQYTTQHNMITDTGMSNLLGGDKITNLFSYFFIGTGGTPNYRETATNVLSCTGTTLTSSVSTFLVEDDTYNRTIQFSDDSYAHILTRISDTEVTIDRELNFTGLTGRIYNTEINKLESYLAYSNTRGSNAISAVDYGTTHEYVFGGTDKTFYQRKYFDTFQFNFIDTGATIREVGWSRNSSSTSSLCGRLVLDVPVITEPRELLFLKMEVYSSYPIGRISKDPIFGLPAFITAASWQNSNSVKDMYIVDNTVGPMLEYCSSSFGMIFIVNKGIGSAVAIRKRASSNTTYGKPYKRVYSKITFLNNDIQNICGYGVGNGSASSDSLGYFTTRYWFDYEDIFSITPTQLLNITPVVRIERSLTPWNGYQAAPSEPDNHMDTYDGSCTCLGKISRLSGSYLVDSAFRVMIYDKEYDRYIVMATSSKYHWWSVNVDEDYILTVGADKLKEWYNYTYTGIAQDANYFYINRSSGILGIYRKDTLEFYKSVQCGSDCGTMLIIDNNVYTIETTGSLRTFLVDVTAGTATLAPVQFESPGSSSDTLHSIDYPNYVIGVFETRLCCWNKTTGKIAWITEFGSTYIGVRYDEVEHALICFSKFSSTGTVKYNLVNWNAV